MAMGSNAVTPKEGQERGAKVCLFRELIVVHVYRSSVFDLCGRGNPRENRHRRSKYSRTRCCACAVGDEAQKKCSRFDGERSERVEEACLCFRRGVDIPINAGCLCVGWSKDPKRGWEGVCLHFHYLGIAIIRGTLLLEQGGRRG